MGRSRYSAPRALGERRGHGRGYQVAHVAPERRHLLDPGRGEEAVVRRREDVHGLDFRRELAVELVHLELVLEVRDRTQALEDHPRAALAGELDEQDWGEVDLHGLALPRPRRAHVA